jgi:3',5'-cyclic AMP phosphodiesterase CpdA
MTDETTRSQQEEIPEGITRREFLQTSLTATIALGTVTALPGVGFLDVAESASGGPGKGMAPFRFAVISDSHLIDSPQGMKHKFVRTLERAVADINAMNPKPDFVVYGGDIAQLGTRTELEMGKQVLTKLTVPLHAIPGEHDWYLDMGKAWTALFGKGGRAYWSFTHKGVHFVGLNTILVDDYWTARKMTPEERMDAIAELECHLCGLWGADAEQRAWLERDVAKLPKEMPVVLFTHSPLWNYYPRWNFQTKDALQIRKILAKFHKVTSIHGHVHQVVYNKFENFESTSLLATAWPWPYPPVKLPHPHLVMNRVDPGDIFDGVGWSQVALAPDPKKRFVATNHYQEWAKLLPAEVKPGVKA